MTQADLQSVLENPWVINTVTGLIVAVVGGVIIYFMYRHFDRKQKSFESKLTEQNEVTRSSTETEQAKQTSDIKATRAHKLGNSVGYGLVKKIDKLAPFLREDAERSYVDQLVELDVLFRDAKKVGEGSDDARLYLVSKEGFPWVYGEVSLKDYPWLKTLHEDAPLVVKGVIVKFSGHTIELKDITFLDR